MGYPRLLYCCWLSLMVLGALCQDKPLVKPLAAFRGDTIAYIENNFVDHKEYYVHKPLGVLLGDMTIPVGSYLFGVGRSVKYSPYLTICFYSRQELDRRIAGKKQAFLIHIHWEEGALMDTVVALQRKYNQRWTPELERYYSGLTVKDISVSYFTYGPSGFDIKPLRFYRGDTTAYLRANFEDIKGRYVKKTLEFLLKDIGVSLVPGGYILAGARADSNCLEGVDLSFYSREALDRRMGKGPLLLQIKLGAKLALDSAAALFKKNNGMWTSEEEAFYGQRRVVDYSVLDPAHPPKPRPEPAKLPPGVIMMY